MGCESTKEIRLHGRGGQGTLLASRILALAASKEGKYVQSYPIFGSERRGAPVVAYTRIDDTPIRIRTSIDHPNGVIVLDSKLIKTTNVTEGLLKNGILVLNSKEKPPEAFTSNKQFKIAMVDATGVSLEVLGVPITNTAMLGAFSASSNWVKIGSICEAIMNRFDKDEAEKNAKAAMSAYERTVVL